MAVFVLDKRKKPLMPCSEKRARLLLERGRAVVHRRHPFIIRLKGQVGGETQPVRVKIDPGSKVTGIALVRELETIEPATGTSWREAHVLMLAELTHRGRQMSKALIQRRGFRRRRRSANLRYRAPRFDNRRRPDGWLPPSLRHRIDTTLAWVNRLGRWTKVTAISMELARFDTQAMENPEISGVAYQQGTLAGYEVREYLLEKWGRKCAYCFAPNVPLQIDHICSRSKGGSDRVSNLTLSCEGCNQTKGNRPLEEFLSGSPERQKHIEAHAKAPLADAAAVNATRWELYRQLRASGLSVEIASGGRTKWNRNRVGIPKTHALDAVCVGSVETVVGWKSPALWIAAMGRGSYQRTRLTRNGFPRGYLMRQKQAHGFQTGDQVRAEVPDGKKAGLYAGRVAVRASGDFNIQTSDGVIEGISHRHCRLIQRADGYKYQLVAQTGKEGGKREHASRAALSLPGMNAGVSRANG